MLPASENRVGPIPRKTYELIFGIVWSCHRTLNIIKYTARKEQCTVTSQERRHYSWPWKWASCGAGLMRNHDYITATIGNLLYSIHTLDISICIWCMHWLLSWHIDQGPIFIGPCIIYVYLLNKWFLISDFSCTFLKSPLKLSNRVTIFHMQR